MTKEEFIELRNKFPKNFTKKISANKELFYKILDFNINKNLSISQLSYNYFFSIKETPKCEICGKPVSFGGNKKFGYNKFCSKSCVGKNNKGSKIGIGHPSYNIVSDEEIFSIEYKEIKNIKEEIQKAINNYDESNLKYLIWKNNPFLLRAIYELSNVKNFKEKLFHILNDIKEIPKCEICKIENSKFCGIKKGYKICGKCNSKLVKKVKKELIEDGEIYNREKTVKLVQFLYKQNLIYETNLTLSLIKQDYNLINSINFHTEYIKNKKFKEKFYHILNDIKEIPKCEICGKEINIKFITVNKGYSEICYKCSKKLMGMKVSDTLKYNLRTKNYDKYIELLKNDFEILTDKRDFIENGILKYIHKKCGKTFERSRAYFNGCPFCVKAGRSSYEKEIANFLYELNINCITNTKPLKDNSQPGNKGNREIDILIPSHNLGIELNGIYFHSELSGEKDRNYHINKLNLAKENNIQIIQILDSEWISKKEIVKSILRNKLGLIENKIYGRKCEIKEISTKEKDEFLESNHLQGKDKSSIKLGLIYNDELVSVMTFGKRKITGKESFELMRFASMINTTIIGGASKLFNHFLNNYWNKEEITTYADKRYSIGNLYEKLGFNFSHESNSNYWYTKDCFNLIHRSNFMKHKLKDKLELFDPSLTEWENMQINGYDRIWDCGNIVFKYIKIKD